MAYIEKDMQLLSIAVQPTSPNLYSYMTPTDTEATCLTAGYFDNMIDKFRPKNKDFLLLASSDAQTLYRIGLVGSVISVNKQILSDFSVTGLMFEKMPSQHSFIPGYVGLYNRGILITGLNNIEFTLSTKTEILDAWILVNEAGTADTISIKDEDDNKIFEDFNINVPVNTIIRASKLMSNFRLIDEGKKIKISKTNTGAPTTSPFCNVYIIGSNSTG